MSKQKKADKSAHVHQGEKLKDKIQFRDKIIWTEKQQKFLELAKNKDTKILFVKGPAGSSKSLVSVYASLLLLDDKKVSEVMYIRSAVESAENSLGALPGTLEEKIALYTFPFLDKIDELVTKQSAETLKLQEKVSCFATNFARGMSWNCKSIVMDEAQNSSYKELVTILTRLGQFSRLFVLADPAQTDLHPRLAGGFETLYAKFDNEESRAQGIHTFEFTEEDIMRSELVKFIVKKLSAKV